MVSQTFIEGRSSGEAYIELENLDDFERVLSLPKKDLWIGKRYIEIFKSTSEEMEYVLEKAERQANQPWDNVIRVKGLPFKVFQNPIQGSACFKAIFSAIPTC